MWPDPTPTRPASQQAIIKGPAERGMEIEVQVLRWLLAANFHPSTADLGRMRQCLHIFFPAFAGFSAANRMLLARSVMPAARLAIRTAAKPKQSEAPLILKFVFELIQVCHLIQFATPTKA